MNCKSKKEQGVRYRVSEEVAEAEILEQRVDVVSVLVVEHECVLGGECPGCPSEGVIDNRGWNTYYGVSAEPDPPTEVKFFAIDEKAWVEFANLEK